MTVISHKPPALLKLPDQMLNPSEQTAANAPFRARKETLDQAKTRLQKASQDFESFITYYMLKSMRSTISTSQQEGALSGGYGKEAFTEMFDMELAKKMSGNNNRSLSGMLYKSLERVLETQYTGLKPEPAQFKEPLELHQPKSIPVERDRVVLSAGRQPMRLPESASFRMTSEQFPQDTPYLYPDTVSAVPGPKPQSAVYQRPRVIVPRAEIESPKPAVDPTAKVIPNKPQTADRFDEIIKQVADQHGLDSALIKSVIAVESDGNPKAVSPAGAKGLMQLMDSVRQQYDVKNIFDPMENIRAGAAHLKRLITRFGDLKLGLAAYNAGPGNVVKYNGIPPFTETEQYVDKVMAAYDRFKTAQAAAPKVNSNVTDIVRE